MKHVPKNTIIVQQGDRCKRLYWTFHGKLSVLRTLKFIDGLNRPLKDQVTITDPNQEKEELLAIEAKLPFQEPTEFDCTVKQRVLQICELKKGAIFGDHKLESDFELTKVKREVESQEEEPFTVITTSDAEIFAIERQVFLSVIDPECLAQYFIQRVDLPTDNKLREKYYEAESWSRFKKHNKI